MYLLVVNKWVTGFTCGNSHCGSGSELSSHQRETKTWPDLAGHFYSRLLSPQVLKLIRDGNFPHLAEKIVSIEVQLLCKVWYCIIKLVLDNSCRYCPIVNINALLQCEDTKPATADTDQFCTHRYNPVQHSIARLKSDKKTSLSIPVADFYWAETIPILVGQSYNIHYNSIIHWVSSNSDVINNKNICCLEYPRHQQCGGQLMGGKVINTHMVPLHA